MLVRVALDGQVRIFQETKIDDVAGIFEIDQDADLLSGFRRECPADERGEVEWRVGADGDLFGDGHDFVTGFTSMPRGTRTVIFALRDGRGKQAI
jgi:hypothetical protein